MPTLKIPFYFLCLFNIDYLQTSFFKVILILYVCVHAHTYIKDLLSIKMITKTKTIFYSSFLIGL